ncbi:MAG: RDD family protein [Acidimicrobiales bacterium]|nr:RDD family protein [Acidimicrobiales bacterium]
MARSRDPLDADLGSSTPEAAGWWTRAKAALMDLGLLVGALVIPAATLVVGLSLCWDDEVVPGRWVANGVGVSLTVVGALLALSAFVWGGWLFGYRQGVTGVTPGKRRLHIRLIDIRTGEPPGGAKGVGRWLIPVLISGNQGPGQTAQLIDILWPLWDSKNQRLIDKLFHTQVVIGVKPEGTGDSRDRYDLPPSPIS